jgi:hypothetical protein
MAYYQSSEVTSQVQITKDDGVGVQICIIENEGAWSLRLGVFLCALDLPEERKSLPRFVRLIWVTSLHLIEFIDSRAVKIRARDNLVNRLGQILAL